MAWPVDLDFQEAVQNPRTAFTDPELQAGQPDLNNLGLPRPRSGGFAVVFKLCCGAKNWAVKCFTREFPDQQLRYAAISEHLNRVHLPYTVGFSFLSDGIRVRGRRYPILKMEWVEGDTLDDYIKRHLNTPHELYALAQRWSQMLAALQQAQIGHGDLQDRNVIIVHDDIRLIDYDGMYVPALQGRGSHELGARNYQHPLRTLADFGPHLDNFSAWVVHLSLLALIAEPQLWQRFAAGDECVLLRRKDFEDPESSAVLQAIEALPEEHARTVAQLFKSLLYLAPEQIPPLGHPTGFAPTAHRAPASWLEDHLPNRRTDSTQTPTSAPIADGDAAPVDVSWIIDGATPPARAQSFEGSPTPERVVFGISVIGAAALVLATQAGLVAAVLIPPGLLSVAAVPLLFCVIRYLSDPSVARRRSAHAGLDQPQRKLREAKRVIQAAAREKAIRQQRHAEAQSNIAKQRNPLEEREKREIAAVQATLQSRLQEINTHRRALLQQQAAALQKIQLYIGGKVSSLDRQIRDLDQGQSTELTTVLRLKQDEHVNNYLRRFVIDDVLVVGIGQTYKLRLRMAGVVTAADVDPRWGVQGVHGIGPRRAEALASWRRSIESRARASMPQTLSQREAAAIQVKYQHRRASLETERDRQRQLQRDEEQTVRSRDRFKLDDSDREESQAKKTAHEHTAQIQTRSTAEYAPLGEALAKLAADLQDDLRSIDGRANEMRKETFQLTWQEAQARGYLKAFAAITFPYYLRRVLLTRRP